MVDKVFITDERREVLRGERTNVTDQTLRNAKSRIRTRSRTALEELIEVAESDEIDNQTVFDQATVVRLIAAIVSPPGKQVTPRWNYDGTDDEYHEEYDYEMNLTWRLDRLIDGYSDQLLRTEPPRSVDRDGFGGLVDDDE